MRKLLLAALLCLAVGGAQAQLPITGPLPKGSAPAMLTPSSPGTTGSITVTLPAAAGKFTYICGFIITSGGTTSATLGDATITGTQATMHYEYVFPAAGTQGVLGVTYSPSCISSSAVNTAIVLTVPAGGAGTVVEATLWGFQL
jgi:hypothetical protein